MNLTIEIPEALTTQQSALTASIAEIVALQEKLASQKLEAETSLRRIDTAIKFLKGESIPLVKPEGARRPMSQASKDAIRAGLLASAARKKAAAEVTNAVPQAVEAASAPAPAPDAQVKASSAKKGAGK